MPRAPTHMIEVIGEPNRSASIRMSNYNGSAKSSEKKGDVPQDDVRELMSLVSSLRGFPSHPSKDVYGLDTKISLNTMEIQWSNEEDDAAMQGGELAGEQKDEFKRIVESVEALGRQFARQDSAV
ncbi:tartrate dehydrogenase decarboxylase [Pyrenophora seminiperda CCB06]|uniref:Tartrate dehydrogenase decarboxylase n=1 Tax=Pyrenophora seminiperda CCB06 TaxID=1302712 RepID=A0A3M7MBR2_9PLEO|nr:tartrate dehydrogenase decarboxylase [Pyrenophora seminiperda CCB06]